LVPKLLVQERHYLEKLERALSVDPSRVQVFEADWERATQRRTNLHRQVNAMNLRVGASLRQRERLCWELVLMRYRCWALEAELGGPVDFGGAFLSARDYEHSTRREILDGLASRLNAVLDEFPRGYYDGWRL